MREKLHIASFVNVYSDMIFIELQCRAHFFTYSWFYTEVVFANQTQTETKTDELQVTNDNQPKQTTVTSTCLHF